AGAHEMDCHFLNEPAGKNIPVILAMLDVWYNNFFAAETHAVVPYDQRLRLLPDYLSQLIMESNGKGVTNRNKQLKHHSSPVFWGSVGTNAQHAFFQLLHQGTHLVPVDFLLPLQSSRAHNQHHKLVANCLAQSKALMLGQENSTEPYRDFPGNRPSTTIAYTQLTPRSLGMILAMYEHRTFAQAVVWDINPFDQWGVELGKQLAKEIINELEKEETGNPQHDSSTMLLIDHYLKSAR
ncbi:MAG: glucose-6-phosphate isomerase, partial [Gammaproteobacteria bacterium]